MDRVVNIEHFDPGAWRRSKEIIRLHLFSLKDGTVWAPRVAVIAGRRDGPVVALVAGQHGDEWNGIYIAHLLVRAIEHQDIDGKLIVLPIANPFAFLQKSRTSILDQVDMNRNFAKSGDRSPTMRAANTLMEKVFARSDYLIDVHTGGPGEYLPNVGIVEQGRFTLARQFNLGRIMVVAQKDHGTLAAACERRSIPTFSLQVGRALNVDHQLCAQTVEGIINFLRGVGMIAEPAESLADQELYTKKTVVLAEEAGFFSTEINLGQEVEAGQSLGVITPLFGEPIEVSAPVPGRAIFLRREAVVGIDDSLVHLAQVDSAR